VSMYTFVLMPGVCVLACPLFGFRVAAGRISLINFKSKTRKIFMT